MDVQRPTGQRRVPARARHAEVVAAAADPGRSSYAAPAVACWRWPEVAAGQVTAVREVECDEETMALGKEDHPELDLEACIAVAAAVAAANWYAVVPSHEAPEVLPGRSPFARAASVDCLNQTTSLA